MQLMGIASAFALRATADKSLHPSYALRFMAGISGKQEIVLGECDLAMHNDVVA
jgi:hypothetical protein